MADIKFEVDDKVRCLRKALVGDPPYRPDPWANTEGIILACHSGGKYRILAPSGDVHYRRKEDLELVMKAPPKAKPLSERMIENLTGRFSKLSTADLPSDNSQGGISVVNLIATDMRDYLKAGVSPKELREVLLISIAKSINEKGFASTLCDERLFKSRLTLEEAREESHAELITNKVDSGEVSSVMFCIEKYRLEPAVVKKV